jgi:site-specific recombinase XerD
VISGELGQRISDYVEESKAASTRRAYRSDWQQFTSWCQDNRLPIALPVAPETIAAYLTTLADDGRAVSTIQRKLAAIAFAHELAEVEVTTRRAIVARTMEGIRRAKGTAPRQARPTLTADIRAMVMQLPATNSGIRNRALLLLGFAGAFRRSELVSLNIEDIEEDDDGLRILIRKSKTDQAGEGRWVGIPRGQHLETCPVRAYQAWIETAAITAGAVFRRVNRHGHIFDDRLDDRAVARVVKETAKEAGLNPKNFSGHSLRAGFVTAAYRAGAREVDIMAQTGHRRIDTLAKYVRKDKVLGKQNAARKVGL